MKPLRVFFYVQHLLGVGHVYRATRIANGLARKGADVHLIWGGTEVPGFDFTGLTVHRLTPVRSGDVSFSDLVHADGKPFSAVDREKRCFELLDLFNTAEPDILITEAFPFGRRQMRHELIPLLDAAVAAPKRPMIVASIRDIMQEDRKQSRVDESNRFVETYFDLILVHGDQRLIRIEDTLQGVEQFSEKVRYTGLVTPDPVFADVPEAYHCDVLVSVGGGAFGQELAETALKAFRLSDNSRLCWLIATGSQMPEVKFEKLLSSASSNLRIARFIPNLMSVMKIAKVSVSHAGYNTVGDVLRAETMSVLYPYTGGRETEQLRRSRLMQRHGLAEMIEPGTLSAQSLSDAIAKALDQKPERVAFDLEGAEHSAHILLKEYARVQPD